MGKVDQKGIAEKYGLDLGNLQTKQITHEDNPVTKKDIFEHLTKKQKGQIEFYYEKNELTWQDLDPRLNRYNSVRYQYIKNSGHMIAEEIKAWHCYAEGCEHFQTIPIQYFISYGDDKKTICDNKIHQDDILIIGQEGASSTHVLRTHPDIASKKLGKMGVKLG